MTNLSKKQKKSIKEIIDWMEENKVITITADEAALSGGKALKLGRGIVVIVKEIEE